MEFRHTQLDNGLSIIAEPNPDSASMGVGFFARTGSRDEPSDLSGISHFLEHMMFKGTAHRSASQVNRDLDEIGAGYNASTSPEDTIYYAVALPEFQHPLLDVLCDIMRPSLRQEDFDLEKQVILEEIAMLDDSPAFRMFERMMKLHFDHFPLGNSVRGTTESVGNLTRQQMQEYFDRQYSPGNVTVVGVGKVDYPRFVEQVRQLCSTWNPYRVDRDTQDAKTTPKRDIISDETVTRQHVGLISPAPPRQDPQRYCAELLAAIVGDVTGSRLYYALIDPAITDEASMSYQPMDGSGVFTTFLSADPDKGAQALRIAREQLEKFRDEGPSEKELQAAKNKIATAATLSGELPIGRLRTVGTAWVYRNEYVSLAEQIDRFFAVSGKQVWELARRYDIASVTTVALGPLEDL